MSTNPNNSPLFGILFFIGMGIFITLLSFGVITFPPSPNTRARGLLNDGAYHWQLTAVGLVFFFGGMSALFEKLRMKYAKLNNRPFFWFSIVFITTAAILFLSAFIWLLVSGTSSLPLKLFGVLILCLGGIGIYIGLSSSIRGIPFQIELTDDPIQQAEVYIRYCNIEVAKTILRDALVTHPERTVEIQKLLDSIT